jgi:hypothetical protein
MAGPRLKSTDFVQATRGYVKNSIEKANKDHNPYLTKAEAKALPKDLRDNFENHRLGAQKNGRVTAKKFEERYVGYVETHMNKADANKDGYLTWNDLKRLPADLRDNAKDYLNATNTLHKVGSEITPTRAGLFDKLEKGVAKHEWKELLPLFDKQNRIDQHDMGINDAQYLSEGFGLHMQDNQLPGSATLMETLHQVSKIKLNRTPVSSGNGYEEYKGTATLKDGSKLNVNLFVKPVTGGFVIDPPVG